MLPIVISQAIFGLSLISLIVLVVKRFSRLKALPEENLEPDEKLADFIQQKFGLISEELASQYRVLQAAYFKLLTRALHNIRILSLRLDHKSTQILNQVKSKALKESGPETEIKPILTGSPINPTQEANSSNGIPKEAFFEHLKEEPEHKKLRGKIRSLKRILKKNK